MWPLHPTAKNFPDLPLLDGNEVDKPAMKRLMADKLAAEQALAGHLPQSPIRPGDKQP